MVPPTPSPTSTAVVTGRGFRSSRRPLRRDRRRGLTAEILTTRVILNVGSTAGYQPFPGQVGYAATKAFVKNYTEGLRGELAGTGVTVALLCPGPVRTEFLQNAGMDERTFADWFPKFMWMPSREVARIGVDALDRDRGTVIAGLPNRISTRLFQFIPRRLLLPLLANQHPELRRDRSAS